VFASARKGNFDIYQKSSFGSAEAVLLLQSGKSKLPSSFSPNGKLVVYMQRSEQTGYDIWILPLSGKREPYAFLQTPFNELVGELSPDGQWMAYVSDESGRNEVYVTRFPDPDRKWQVSTSGGETMWWRQDGKEVLYQEESGRLMAAEVSARGDTFEVGLVEPLFETTPNLVAPTPDAQRFLVARRTGEESPTPLTLVINWTAELKR
jgi:Tol biopolymer transport system component